MNRLPSAQRGASLSTPPSGFERGKVDGEMAQGDKCGNCERCLKTVGYATGVCVLPEVPPWRQKSFAERIGEVVIENTDVCEYYKRARGGND